MGVILDIPNVWVLSTVSGHQLLFGDVLGEFVKVLGEVVVVVDKIGVPEGHQVGNELVIRVCRVVAGRGSGLNRIGIIVVVVAQVNDVVVPIPIVAIIVSVVAFESCENILRLLVVVACYKGFA
jgi:hypothetical protein